MEDDSQQEEFLLKWNDHHNSFFNIVQDLCTNELLTDVTLACGSGEPVVFEAHKLMLSVSSAFFRNILTRKRADRYPSHPIVFLKDVNPRHMEQLLQYMYRGEINVLQDDLEPLIETARALQVKGLADAPPGSGSSAAKPPKSNNKRPPAFHGNTHHGMPPLPMLKQQFPPPLKKAKVNPGGLGGLQKFPTSKESQQQQVVKPHPAFSQLAQRLIGGQPKHSSQNIPIMPRLPTEPEPPEAVLKEDQIDLWGQAVTGEAENSGDGVEFGAFAEGEDDAAFNQDQVSVPYNM